MDQPDTQLGWLWDDFRCQRHTLVDKRMSLLPTNMQWPILARQLLMIDHRIWCLVSSSNTTLSLFRSKYQNHGNHSSISLFDCAALLVDRWSLLDLFIVPSSWSWPAARRIPIFMHQPTTSCVVYKRARENIGKYHRDNPRGAGNHCCTGSYMR